MPKSSTRPHITIVVNNSPKLAQAAETKRRQRDDTIARLRQAQNSARSPTTRREIDRRLALMQENPQAVTLYDVGVYGPPPD